MIKAKKSLGQNFLIDENIIKKITNLFNLKNKIILEVGPGTGNLTNSLLKCKAKKVYVIEKDDNLASLLEKKFFNEITVINEDILKVKVDELNEEKLMVFGNLPYNISTEILCKWILDLKDEKFWFTELILMFQKEVADRIISNIDSSNYGRLSILAQWKLNVRKILDIKPNSFLPRPKVDSSLLVFSPKKNFFKIQNPYNLEKITRVFFSHRRKMIKKPFNQVFANNTKVLKDLNIDLKLRPQNLDFETYYKLTSEYEKLRS